MSDSKPTQSVSVEEVLSKKSGPGFKKLDERAPDDGHSPNSVAPDSYGVDQHAQSIPEPPPESTPEPHPHEPYDQIPELKPEGSYFDIPELNSEPGYFDIPELNSEPSPEDPLGQNPGSKHGENGSENGAEPGSGPGNSFGSSPESGAEHQGPELKPPEPERSTTANFIYGVVLFGVVYGLTVLIQNYFMRDKVIQSSEPWDMSPLERNPNRFASSGAPPKLEQIAQNLVRSENWDVQKIHFLKRTLLTMEPQEKMEMVRKPWMADLEQAIERELSQVSIKEVFTNDKVILRQNALVDVQSLIQKARRGEMVLAHKKHQQETQQEFTERKESEADIETTEPLTIAETAKITPREPFAALSQPSEADQSQRPKSESLKSDSKAGVGETQRVVKQEALPPQGPGLANMKVVDNSAFAVDRKTGKIVKNKQAKVVKPKPVEVKKPPEKPKEVIATFAAKEKAGVSAKQLSKKTLLSTIEKPESKKYFYVNGRTDFKAKRNKAPTVAELNSLTIQLISAYETGDLEKFGSLFDDDPESEYYTQLEQVKSEYEDLVYQTSDRQMFIRDMKWSFKGNVAVGKGTLTLVTLFSSQSQVLNRKKGLEMIARKDKGKILITRFE